MPIGIKKPTGPTHVSPLAWSNLTQFFDYSTGQFFFTARCADNQPAPQTIVPGIQKLQKGDLTFPQVAPMYLNHTIGWDSNGHQWEGWFQFDHWEVWEIETNTKLAEGGAAAAPSVPISANGVVSTAFYYENGGFTGIAGNPPDTSAILLHVTNNNNSVPIPVESDDFFTATGVTLGDQTDYANKNWQAITENNQVTVVANDVGQWTFDHWRINDPNAFIAIPLDPGQPADSASFSVHSAAITANIGTSPRATAYYNFNPIPQGILDKIVFNSQVTISKDQSAEGTVFLTQALPFEIEVNVYLTFSASVPAPVVVVGTTVGPVTVKIPKMSTSGQFSVKPTGNSIAQKKETVPIYASVMDRATRIIQTISAPLVVNQ